MKQLKGYNAEAVRGMEREALDKYKNMSEDALIGRLIEMVHAQKQNGTFDEVQLLGFVNTLTPHLNAQQRRRLESVLGMIDE